MRKAWKPLDYMFYRLAELFLKKDGSEGIRAIGLISLMQGLYVGFALLMLTRKVAGQDFIDHHPKLLYYLSIPFSLLVLLLNYRRYSYQFYKIAERWRHQESPLQRVTRGMLVLLALGSSFFVFLFALL